MPPPGTIFTPSIIKNLTQTLSSFGTSGYPLLPTLSHLLFRASSLGGAISSNRFDRFNRKASVLIPLISIANEPHILFTQRSTIVGSHKGQISFPGGHVEEGESSLDAAIRETYEELGPMYIPSSSTTASESFQGEEEEILTYVQALGQTGTIPAITGTMVRPILGFINRPLSSKADLPQTFKNKSHDEVSTIFALSLKELSASEGEGHFTNPNPAKGPLGQTMATFRGGFKGPTYDSGLAEGSKIWGLTAMILQPLLKDLLVPAFYGTDIEEGVK
jgi:hypothetical protein